MELIEAMLTNGQTISFGMLFVGLLVYVMKTNEAREENYRDTIKNMTEVLGVGIEQLKGMVDDIKGKMGI